MFSPLLQYLDTTSRSVVSGLGTDVGRELCRQQQNVDEAGLAAILGDRSPFAFIVDSIQCRLRAYSAYFGAGPSRLQPRASYLGLFIRTQINLLGVICSRHFCTEQAGSTVVVIYLRHTRTLVLQSERIQICDSCKKQQSAHLFIYCAIYFIQSIRYKYMTYFHKRTRQQSLLETEPVRIYRMFLVQYDGIQTLNTKRK